MFLASTCVLFTFHMELFTLPQALLRHAILSVCSHIPARLPPIYFHRLRMLGIASSPRSRRSYRGGRAAMRSRAAKCYLHCGLANTRSLGNSCALVEDHIVYNNLDVFVITETWLTSVDGDDILRAACPAGYSALHIPRIGRRGGGVALIYCSSIVLKKITLVHVPVSFEYLAVALTVNSSLITIVVVYRPPASNFGLFIEEFSTLLEILSTYPGRILIVGDFNIHVDDPLNPAAAKF